MKKMVVSVVVCMLLAACSAQTTSTSLDGLYFTGRYNSLNSLEFKGNTLIVKKGEDNIKPSMEPEDVRVVKNEQQTYKGIQVEIKDDRYYITGDDEFSMTLKNTGKRIVEDASGEEYVASYEF